ncbi:MAG: hypothetical protein AAF573_18915 [Bacteroidota bacterium]
MKHLPFLLLIFIMACGANKTTTNEPEQAENVARRSSKSLQDTTGHLLEVADSFPGEDEEDNPTTEVPKNKVPPTVRFKDRKVLFKPPFQLQPAQSGKVTIKICIRKNGSVASTSIDKNNTTITDQDILNYILDRGRKYQFSPSEYAPEIQCGSLDFQIVKD